MQRVPPNWNIIILAPLKWLRTDKGGAYHYSAFIHALKFAVKLKTSSNLCLVKSSIQGSGVYFPPTTLNPKPQTLNPGLGFATGGLQRFQRVA